MNVFSQFHTHRPILHIRSNCDVAKLVHPKEKTNIYIYIAPYTELVAWLRADLSSSSPDDDFKVGKLGKKVYRG